MFLSGIFSNLVTDNRWLAKQVTFPGSSSTTTRVRYVARYDMRDDRGAYYIYGTGSYWKGTIGKATFTIDGNGAVARENFHVKGLHKLETANKVVSETAVTYEVRDFEPEPDATLEIWS